MSDDVVESRLARIERRLLALEEVLHDDPIARVKDVLQQHKVFSAVLVRVPSDYYKHELDIRARIVRAQNTSQLCKSIIFENTAYFQDNEVLEDFTNSRYYCVVIQYAGFKI
jgi:hypothetical protein